MIKNEYKDGGIEVSMMINKLENPIRLKELKPAETLIQIGLSKDDIFCDIGAGTGIFAFAALEITNSIVYAVDSSKTMRDVLYEKNRANSMSDKFIVEDSLKNVPNLSCDVAFMCTVLHELENAEEVLESIKHILKPNGKIAVIDFHKAITPIGPPLADRISIEDTLDLLHRIGFIESKRFTLGDNFYCVVFCRE